MSKEKPVLESKLQSKILRSARGTFKGKIIAFKIDASIDGVPDLLMAIEGFGGVFIEVKRDIHSKPRPSQLFIIKKLRLANLNVEVVNSWESWIVLKNNILAVISNK